MPDAGILGWTVAGRRRDGELVAVPVQYGHLPEHRERIVRDIGESQRCIADLDASGGFDRRTQCRGDQLRTQTYPQRRQAAVDLAQRWPRSVGQVG